ncbi:MAG: methylenetetrahydrofolate reductase [Pacificimonas sp.]
MSIAPPEPKRAHASPMFADLAGDISVSFEFFPPATDKMEATLWESIKTLEPLKPRFVSVTYGAGGSTRDRTHSTVARLVKETSLTPAAHLTCVDASRGEIDEIADEYWDAGVRHIVALRGDPPREGEAFSAHADGYDCAASLIEGLRKRHDFEISVAAYPEQHPESGTLDADLDNLKRKLDAGGTRAITQFFFSPDRFFEFRDAAAAAGIDAELVPGILPVSNFKQTKKFAALNGTDLPGWLARLFEGLDDKPDARKLVAATVAAEMCRRLYAGGIRDFHFYTLNRAELSYAICHMLGMRADAEGVVT